MSVAPAAETPAVETNKAAAALDTATEVLKALAGGQRQNAGARVWDGQAPHVTSGEVGRDRPYSMLKAVAAAMGRIPKDKAKYEYSVHERLQKFYTGQGPIGSHFGGGSFLVPASTAFLPTDTAEQESLQTELRQKFAEDKAISVDPDEVGWLRKRLGAYTEKALDSRLDTAGGPLVGFPTLGEFIDMQRNFEAFSRAGASQVPLGPNGQMYYPKLISGATAYFVNENPASALTSSQPTTGNLNLMAKTLAVNVPISNQLLKFNLISAEAMVREDMARVAALKADSSMFAGVGGTEIKGLLTYDRTSNTAWTSGTDKVVGVTASTTGGTGDTMNSKDLYRMIGFLPDEIGDGTAWLIRKNYFWSQIATARAGGSATGDGPYLHSFMRSLEQGIGNGSLLGNKLVLSANVPANRVKSSGVDLTCVILGNFRDWLIGRAGVMELDANPYGDTVWGNIQTQLRAVQYIDAGPRHAASFAVCDQLLQTAFTA